MIDDLDESLRQLLIKEAGLDPAEVDISFDIPTRDWSTSSAATRPTVNLYLYDVRENRQLREMGWDAEPETEGRVKLRRLPVRVDLSYMVTCWTSTSEDQHRLLWRVMETFFRHSPLPEHVLEGNLRRLIHPVRTEVAQPDGVLKNVSDFWGALENQLRPSVNLIVTLDLDLAQITSAPLVFAKVLKYGQAAPQGKDGRPALAPGWEAAPLGLGGVVRTNEGRALAGASVGLDGVVRTNEGRALAGASVRLIGVDARGRPAQFGPSVETGPDGRYRIEAAPPGAYTLVIEAAGHTPHQEPITLAVRERGQPLPELVHEVEVTMA